MNFDRSDVLKGSSANYCSNKTEELEKENDGLKKESDILWKQNDNMCEQITKLKNERDNFKGAFRESIKYFVCVGGCPLYRDGCKGGYDKTRKDCLRTLEAHFLKG